MKDKCLNCGLELNHFDGRRKKIFCSAKCRVNYNRKKDKPEVVSIPKNQLDELLGYRKQINELMSRAAGHSEERNGSPSSISATTNAALAESIADVAPSGLKLKNNPKKEVVPAKEPEVVESPKKHRLWKNGDPEERTNTFYLKFGAFTYNEIEKL